jgi:DNA topoisomerase I
VHASDLVSSASVRTFATQVFDTQDGSIEPRPLCRLGAFAPARLGSLAVDVVTLEPPDPRAATRHAGLRYVGDDEPGLRRRRHGRGFVYLDEAGERIGDPEVRARIEALVIPPAWQDVWICRDERGHLQATGRDEAGRKQYLYHPRWRETRDLAKFDALVTFGNVLPSVRRRVRRDLRRGPTDRASVTAAIVKLMDTTLVRVGNAAYARTNGSYGLTTLRSRHVRVEGDELALRFAGKGGAEHDLSLHDEELARVVRECQEIPGYEVFQYRDDDGSRHTIDSSDVNAYLRQAAGESVTAKDFRTWGATVLTARGLHRHEELPTSERGRNRLAVATIKEVAAVLHNTPAVCRASYVHPQVIGSFMEGSFPERYADALDAARRKRPRELRLHEGATLRFLED